MLPDGRVLEVQKWLESLPPQPQGLREVAHIFTKETPESIAKLVNGVVAELQ